MREVDAQGTPTQSHISPSILVHEDKPTLEQAIYGRDMAHTPKNMAYTPFQTRQQCRASNKSSVNVGLRNLLSKHS